VSDFGSLDQFSPYSFPHPRTAPVLIAPRLNSPTTYTSGFKTNANNIFPQNEIPVPHVQVALAKQIPKCKSMLHLNRLVL